MVAHPCVSRLASETKQPSSHQDEEVDTVKSTDFIVEQNPSGITTQAVQDSKLYSGMEDTVDSVETKDSALSQATQEHNVSKL